MGNIDRARIQSWNVAFERRLPWDLAVDVAYVANRSDGGYADLDINAPAVVGGGNASRPYFVSQGRNLRVDLWGQRLKTRYNALQVAINRPFTKGLLLKGAYTLGKSKNFGTDDDGWTGLAFNTPSLLDRNYSNAGYDRRHNFQLGFVYQLPWQSGSGGNPLKADHQRLADERRGRHVQRPAVLGHRQQRRPQHTRRTSRWPIRSATSS